MKLMALVLSLYSANAFSYWKIKIQENEREKSPLIISNHQPSGNKLILRSQCTFSQIGNARDSRLEIQCQRGDEIMKLDYPCSGAEDFTYSYSKDRASMNLNVKCFYM